MKPKEFVMGALTVTVGVLVGMVIYSQVQQHLLGGAKGKTA